METKESILSTMNSALRTYLEKNGLSLEDVMNLSVRDLNKILSRHAANNDVKQEIKRLRRKLKNRCYAANSRTRRLTETAQVQLARDQLSAENERLKARMMFLERQFERVRGMYEVKRQHFDQNRIPIPLGADIDIDAICRTTDEPDAVEEDRSDEMDAEIDEGIETGSQRSRRPTGLPLDLDDGFSLNSSSASSSAPNSPGTATSGAPRTLKPKTRLLSRFITDGQSASASNSPRTSECEMPATAAAASLALASQPQPQPQPQQQQQQSPQAPVQLSTTTNAPGAYLQDSRASTTTAASAIALPLQSVDDQKPSIVEHNGQYYVIAPVPAPHNAVVGAVVPSLGEHLARQG